MNSDPPTLIQQLRNRSDARYASKLQDQRFDTLRRRPVRRGLVGISFLLLAGAVAFVWAGASGGAAYLVTGLLFVGALGSANATMRTHWPDRALDERLIAVRSSAYRRAYHIVGVVTGVGLLVVSVLWQTTAGFALEPRHLRAILLGFVGLTLSMPTAVLAWREREI